MKSQVIIPGAVKSGRSASGFNLNKFVKKLLESMGFAATVDCCTYYPTYPIVVVASDGSPTEEEMANIPIGGIFIARTSEGIPLLGSVRIKADVDASAQIVNISV